MQRLRLEELGCPLPVDIDSASARDIFDFITSFWVIVWAEETVMLGCHEGDRGTTCICFQFSEAVPVAIRNITSRAVSVVDLSISGQRTHNGQLQ